MSRRQLLRPSEWPAPAQALATALLLTVISWYLGADVWYSILLGGVLATLAWIGLSIASAPEPGDTDWDHSDRTRDGARGDVAQLSRTLRGSYGRVGDGALWQVRQIARRRLTAYELDLLDPADRRGVEQVIGRRTYKILVRRRRRPPSMRALLRCLDALDAMDPDRPARPSLLRRQVPTLSRPLPRRARGR